MAKPAEVDFTLTLGDDESPTFTLLDGSSAYDLTGVTAALFVAYLSTWGTGAAPVLSKTLGSGVTVTDAAAGEIQVALADDDFDGVDPGASQASLVYRLQITLASGAKVTWVRGRITVLPAS